jgi:uncharacterized protein
MVRPRKIKFVNFEPDVTYFKPRAVPLSMLEEVELTVDELETLRLSNIKKLSQAAAAKKMKIHQSTFQRTLTRAREKITDALVNGKAIKIQGGEYKMVPRGRGQDTGAGRRIGMDRRAGDGGRMDGHLAAGPGGECVCSKCKHTVTHQRGQPCMNKKCPKCNSAMTRG